MGLDISDCHPSGMNGNDFVIKALEAQFSLGNDGRIKGIEFKSVSYPASSWGLLFWACQILSLFR
jgi:hypothetical protein